MHHNILNMKNLTLLFFLAFTSLGYVVAQEVDLAGSYYHFSQAKIYESKADYTKAVDEFEKAISIDSQSSQMRIEFARVLLKIGNVNHAIQQCEKATELNPSDSASHFLLAQIYSNLSNMDGVPTPLSEKQDNINRAILEFEQTVELDPEHFEAFFYLGQLHLEMKNYQSSLDSFSQCLQLRPSVVPAYLLKSKAYRGLNNLEAASRVLEQARKYDETNIEMVRELGQLYESSKEYEKASNLYENFLKVVENPEIEFRYALVLSQQERLFEAGFILQRLSNNDPDNLRLKILLGEVLKRRKSYVDASKVFRQVLEVEPNNFTANFRLAESLARVGERKEAIEILLHMLEINGSDQDAVLIRTSLAFVYQDARQFEKSIALFQAIIQKNSENDLAKLRLSYVFKESGQLEKALTLSKELLGKYEGSSYKDNPQKEYYLIAHAQILSAANRLQEAIQLLRDQRLQHPKPDELYVVESQLYLEHKDYFQAQQLIEEAISQYSDKEKLQFQLAAIYERQGEFEKSTTLFKKILRKNPEHAGVLNYLGYMLADKGIQLKEALGYIERALRLDPHNGAYLDSLGWVYFRLNELEKAELNLTKAVRTNDSDATIFDHLGDLYFRLGKYHEAHKYYERSILFSTEEEEQRKVKKKLSDVNGLLSRESN